jgi:hypothetical protein
VVTVFAHATEDERKVREALGGILPPSVPVESFTLTGHFGNPITVFRARLGGSQTRELWSRIGEGFRDGTLVRALLRRVDDSCVLYLRFDKQKACVGELSLTDRGDAIHIKMKIAARPARRDVAVERLSEFLREWMT